MDLGPGPELDNTIQPILQFKLTIQPLSYLPYRILLLSRYWVQIDNRSWVALIAHSKFKCNFHSYILLQLHGLELFLQLVSIN